MSKTFVYLHNHTEYSLAETWSDVEREIRRLWRNPVPVSRPVERWADAQAPQWDDFTRPAPEAFITSAERHQAPLTEAQCRRLWDGLTDAIAEQRHRKAARPETPIPLNAAGRERWSAERGRPERVRAVDQASFDAWQQEQIENATESQKPDLTTEQQQEDRWAEFERLQTDKEREAGRLLIGALPGGGYVARRFQRKVAGWRSNYEVAEILGVTEAAVRKRRASIARKAQAIDIMPKLIEDGGRGPDWCARRQAPRGTPARSGLAEARLEPGVRTAPIYREGLAA